MCTKKRGGLKGPGRPERAKNPGHIMYPYHIGEKAKKPGPKKNLKRVLTKGAGCGTIVVGPEKVGPPERPRKQAG